MVDTISEIQVKLSVDTSSFDSALSKAGENIKKFSSSSKNASKETSIFDGIIGKVALSVQGLKPTISGLVTQFVKLGAVVGAAVASFLSLKKGIEANKELQKTVISLEAVFGSAEKANKVLKELTSISLKSPFNTSTLVSAAKTMTSLGVDASKATDWVKKLGDGIAGVGGGKVELEAAALAIGQIAGNSKVTAQDMKQLLNAGIPSWKKLSEATGIASEKLQEFGRKGQLLSEDVLPILLDKIEADAPNAMAAMGAAFEGEWNKMIALVGEINRVFVLPFFNAFINIISYLNKFLSTFRENLTSESGGWAEAFKSILPKVLEGAVDTVAGWFVQLGEAIGSFDWGIFGKLIGDLIVGTLKFVFFDAPKAIANALWKMITSINWSALNAKIQIFGIELAKSLLSGLFNLIPGAETILNAFKKLIGGLGKFLGKIPGLSEFSSKFSENFKKDYNNFKKIANEPIIKGGVGFSLGKLFKLKKPKAPTPEEFGPVELKLGAPSKPMSSKALKEKKKKPEKNVTNNVKVDKCKKEKLQQRTLIRQLNRTCAPNGGR